MKNNYLEKLLRTFSGFDYSKQTTARVHGWLADEAGREEKDEALQELWQETKPQSHIDTERPFAQVLEKLGIPYAQIPESFNRRWRWRLAAAVTVGIIFSSAVSLWLGNSLWNKDNAVMAECHTRASERKTILLPDGSEISLNAGSHLYYPVDLEGKTRTVYLAGEANFKVAKNPKKPFIVRSSNMHITALGTEFNVKAYPEENLVTASLIKGKVRVNCNDTYSYILNPGSQVVFDKETQRSNMQSTNLNDVTAWQRGEIVLNKASIEEILQTLERHFGVEFHVLSKRKENNDRYNFVFKENADIGEVLDVMRVVVGHFNYRLKGDTCYLNW